MDKKSFSLGDIYNGDCLDVLKSLEENSIDSVVTDPPYGISFMGRKWDYDVPSEEIWRECIRVLKPGGHLLAFAGTRTQHRMAVRIEDAGFEIRDMIAWVYGSGFPKSLDVSKAIDKAAGAEREVVGEKNAPGKPQFLAAENGGINTPDRTSRAGFKITITAPAADAAKQWSGWGTALKPSLEPVTVARKPLSGTVVENVLGHGTGGLNVDGCRVTHSEECRMMSPSQANINNPSEKYQQAGRRKAVLELKPSGRWPANLIHDGSDEVLELFPESGGSGKGTGSAARFFYCAKASKSERNHNGKINNRHPTVKPLELMRYLVRLVTPKGGIVLDPFLGSGTTVVACHLEGMRFVVCEKDADSFETACERARLSIPVVSQFETDE